MMDSTERVRRFGSLMYDDLTDKYIVNTSTTSSGWRPRYAAINDTSISRRAAVVSRKIRRPPKNYKQHEKRKSLSYR